MFSPILKKALWLSIDSKTKKECKEAISLKFGDKTEGLENKQRRVKD